MKTYDIRSRDLTGIVITFDQSEASLAWAWYDQYYLKMEPGDSRYGHVLVSHTWETEAEANERRMEWLDQHWKSNGGRIDLDLPEGEKGMTLKDYIDSLNKPESKVEILADHFKDKGLKAPGII